MLFLEKKEENEQLHIPNKRKEMNFMSNVESLRHDYNEDKTNDDTLNHIRKEYLESKKQVSELLSQPKMQNFESHQRFYSNSSPIRKPETESYPRENSLDEKLKQQLRGSSAGKVVEPVSRGIEDYFLRDDVKFLRRVINDQQESIRELKRSLEQQRYINHDLQHKLSSMESRINKLEWSFGSSTRGTLETDYKPKPSVIDVPTHSWDKDLLNSYNNRKPENDRIFSNFDDSTTRLMQITDPRYRNR